MTSTCQNLTRRQNIHLNPFLTDELVEKLPNSRYKIRVWWPDALHYNETLVSPATHKIVQAIPKIDLQNDRKLFEKTTAKIVEDMMTTWLEKIYGQSSDMYSKLDEIVRWLAPSDNHWPVTSVFFCDFSLAFSQKILQNFCVFQEKYFISMPDFEK